jgi:hypothetical protein
MVYEEELAGKLKENTQRVYTLVYTSGTKRYKVLKYNCFSRKGKLRKQMFTPELFLHHSA